MASTMVTGGMTTQLFPAVGPALMISMEYIDLGKWVAAVEGGARFGFDLVFLVLLFNCTAVLCQYLSTCIGMATGKHLAEICSEEYCRVACISLGFQAVLSMIISDLTTILGISYGLNLLTGMNLFTCIFYATVGVVLLPSFLTLLDTCKTEALYIAAAGFALLLYVFGVLISQPEVPLMMGGVFPRLSGESAYSVMALLGANIMAHNFYIHSSIVKQRKKQPTVAMGALFHDHFFAILFIFTGIFLVNYVLMNSAAAVFGSADVVFNSQDVSMLMDQIFRSPIGPLAFFMVLFFSGQITAVTRNTGEQVILQCFFGINISFIHQALLKALTIILAVYCAKSAGSEGIYQLLIFCQVVLATLLPSSVIPLFRVASSRFIMSSLKISWYLEIMALFAFLLLFSFNIFFIIEMLFGNSSWMFNLIGAEDTGTIPFVALLIIACASTGLTLYLAVTPLKSASDAPETQIWTSNLDRDQLKLPEGEDSNQLDVIKYDENHESFIEDALEKSAESQSDKSLLEVNPDVPDSAIDSDHDSLQSTRSSSQSAQNSSVTVAYIPSTYHQEELKSESRTVDEVDFQEISETGSTGGSSDVSIYQKIESKELSFNDEGGESIHLDKENDERDVLEPEMSFKGFPLSSTSEALESFTNTKSKGGTDGSIGSGSLKLSGLGRAARRQLASTLDEFWGSLFDFHGKLTQEANTNRLDVLLGLDLRTVSATVKTDAMGAEVSKSFLSDADMRPVFPPNSRDYNSPKQMKNHNVEVPFGAQMASSSWSQNMQSLNAHVQSSPSALLDPTERPYSSLQVPQYSGNKQYQPATIHGYQIASYLREINANRSLYPLTIPQNLPPTPNSASSLTNLRDQVIYSRAQNELSSSVTSTLQNPALSRISRLQTERPYYEPLYGESGENVISSAYTKKYHSSPDISALIALSKTAYLNEAKRGSPIGPRLPSGRMVSEQSQHLSPVSRGGVPLAFDQLSPPKLHRDVFSIHQSLNQYTKSLWSKQPYEQLFGMGGKSQSGVGVLERPSVPPKEIPPYAEAGAKLLQALRICIMKLLKLEGSEWLFRQNGGYDEELIDRVAAIEKCLLVVDNGEMNKVFSGEFMQLSTDRKLNSFNRNEEADISCLRPIRNCGDGCIWQAALILSFGVWCIRRILELSLVESRPELWGKYTYVLNRLQGIIEPAFSKPRQPLSPCSCLETTFQNGFRRSDEKFGSKSLTTASTILETIKDVELAVSSRKGRTGTAAGDVAFPKGKENLTSVLKRYKRRLLNKSEGASTSRRVFSSSSSSIS